MKRRNASCQLRLPPPPRLPRKTVSWPQPQICPSDAIGSARARRLMTIPFTVVSRLDRDCDVVNKPRVRRQILHGSRHLITGNKLARLPRYGPGRRSDPGLQP
eukprot:665928-Hanusia_phi.AAC.1